MNILEEANSLVDGDRAKAYGPYKEEAARIAEAFNALTGNSIEIHHVPCFMAVLKLAREMNIHKRDNLVDLAGYALCWSRLYDNDA